MLPKQNSEEWRLQQNDSLKREEAEQHSILVGVFLWLSSRALR